MTNKTVAVIGASNERGKFGNKAVRAFSDKGYIVYPVSPRHSEIEGIKVYASVLDIPTEVEIATLYVPAHVSVKLVSDFVKKGIKEVWINPGADSEALLAALQKTDLKIVNTCSLLAIGASPSDY
ncbi:MAG: CoA-binding protein [Verrucomicrobiota bacterium]|nr:CoA-binding protein [Verrucomicrobiota bacterium]